MRPLYLASLSPRRRSLIQLLGRPVEVVDVAVDEESVTDPDPAANAVATAVLKVRAAAAAIADPTAVIIAADTIVAVEGEMLGKPAGPTEARAMLRRLRGREHQVHTGLAVVDKSNGRLLTDVASVAVPMRPYTDDEIAAYVATGDPLDKAGAYAIQHPEFRPVADFGDCYAAVVGLPLCHLARTLRRLGLSVPADVPAACQAHHDYVCPVYQQILAG